MVSKNIPSSVESKSSHEVDLHVGSRIRLRCRILGISQTKLGDALGLTFQQIQKYEKSTNAIPLSKLKVFCEATNTDWSYFFRPLDALDKKIYMNGRAND